MFSTSIRQAKDLIKKDILPLMIGLGLCVLALTASQLAWSRHQVFRAQMSQAQALARSLAQHADNTVKAADIVLQDVAERVQTDGTDPASIARIEKVLASHVTDDARFHTFTLFDANGEAIASSLGKQRRHFNIFTRPYFATARDATQENTPNVAAPVISRSDNTWVISISRAIYLNDGKFFGLINCAVSVDMLQKLYDSINVGQYGAIQLNKSNGDLLVRRPYKEGAIGTNYYFNTMFQSTLGEKLEDNIDFVSVIDHHHRIGTYVKIPRYHLQLAVSFDQTEMLSDWWLQAEFEAALLAAMLLSAIVGFRLFSQQAKQRAISDAQYRLLAEHSYDVIVVADMNGKREYVSPSFYMLTGWTAEQLEGKAPETYTCAEDIPKMFSALQAHKRGENPGPIKFRYVTPNGRLIWMEMVAQMVPATSTSVPKFICSHRDITMRTKAEDALAAANAELSTLMLTDQLTGISNRRDFDQKLDFEWNRASRNEWSVAMMMIDVDWFKAYNDYYGHVEGDQCLRAVAQLLKATARRAGDVVARYGGEEFAIIMPDTSAQEAIEIAERLLSEMTAAAISHAMSEFQIVTISIGITVMVPKRGSDPTMLIQMADKAVYAAKKRGRHQIVLVPPQPGQLRLVLH